ncbi:hypothetical protein KCU81_g8172, partial [Aureobasidium melanogenum]
MQSNICSDSNFYISIFALNDGEYLTEINGSSTPMYLDKYQELHAFPTIWGSEVENGNLIFQPLEYSVGTGDEEVDHASPYAQENITGVLSDLESFLRDLHNAFQTHDLQGLLGLVRHPGIGYPGRLEITLGRCNVNLTPTQAKFVPGKTREAA